MAISKIVYKSSPSATPETWMDATPATAAAADITAPKTAMLANGVVTTGTGTGGGGGSVAAKDVNFIDYDGSIVASYTAQEAAALTALPANPSHTGLTAQGWNWSLANIKAYVQKYPGTKIWVGQMYTTASGDSEIDCVFDDPNFLSPYLTIAVNGTVEVDWGDGSAKDTMTGTSLTTSKYQQHVYAQTGSYMIAIHVVSGSFAFYSSSGNYVGVLRTVNAANNRARSRAYSDQIQAIRIGSGASIGNRAFQYCYSMQSITIPYGVTSIETYAFQYCYSMQSITIPDSVTNIETYAFQSCYALQSITIPDGVTSIGTYAFGTCYDMYEYHFLPTTPPTLASTNAFIGIMTGTVMYVPYSADHSILEAYKTATNWSTYASYMQEEPQ